MYNKNKNENKKQFKTDKHELLIAHLNTSVIIVHICMFVFDVLLNLSSLSHSCTTVSSIYLYKNKFTS